MSLLSSKPNFNYTETNNSVGVASGDQAGTAVTSGSANAYGSWTQIHAGLTYKSSVVVVRINSVETSADVTAATVLNAYIDIGIGPDSSNVTVILEKLGGSFAGGLGNSFYIPVSFPQDTPIWARHQNTQASAKSGVEVTFFGGGGNGYFFPSFSRMVAIGAVTTSTTGASLSTIGNSGAEGGWVEITSSSSDDYSVLMLSPVFNVDSSLTNGLIQTFDIGIGGSGSEISIGENVMQSFLWTGAEQRVSISYPVYRTIPSGTRIVCRGSGSTTNDGTNSILLYGIM